ncbi:SMI1/KNR4 family protein [Aquimarina sediminis]|uniref:SMI1/KNR4 family protein n=1 Tax=Aquimarina sediminis TaxID=2070536 RepID=UPI000CA04A2A|nr:SMI1/KNR4 family protein [Aquimarina sediminis]
MKIWGKIAQYFRKIILENNGGYPTKNIFDTDMSKEKVFSNLLDFNLNNSNNVLDVHSRIKDILPFKVYPFGSEPSGDYLCFDYNTDNLEPNIILWKHEGIVDNGEEVYETEYISNSFEEFLSRLYSEEDLIS